MQEQQNSQSRKCLQLLRAVVHNAVRLGLDEVAMRLKVGHGTRRVRGARK